MRGRLPVAACKVCIDLLLAAALHLLLYRDLADFNLDLGAGVNLIAQTVASIFT
jgi:hypothetical protein